VIVVVPGLTPITLPDKEPIVAIVEDALTHKPPAGEPVSVEAIPGQTNTEPSIAGRGYTVTVVRAAQPDGNV
jgi:hypothetical protein